MASKIRAPGFTLVKIIGNAPGDFIFVGAINDPVGLLKELP
jgi:hypothetical protein